MNLYLFQFQKNVHQGAPTAAKPFGSAHTITLPYFASCKAENEEELAIFLSDRAGNMNFSWGDSTPVGKLPHKHVFCSQVEAYLAATPRDERVSCKGWRPENPDDTNTLFWDMFELPSMVSMEPTG